MRSILKFFVIFLAITGATFLATREFGVTFGNSDFWNHHGVFFLLFIAAFPRLTLLFSDVALGGLFWWLGFFFAPRILVATLATLAYWNQNPILVVLSWLVAMGGESSEKMVVIHRSRGRWAQRQSQKGFDSAKSVDSTIES